MPKIKDFKFLQEHVLANLEGFHKNLDRFTFLYLIWAYDKVFGYGNKGVEYNEIQRLLLKPKEGRGRY